MALGLTAPVLLIAPSPAAATSIEAFEPVFSTNDNGSIAIFGNNLMSCAASVPGCAASQAAQNSTNNNTYVMASVDRDGAAFPTYSSSSSTVVLPADSEVRWAGLYWGARLGAGDRGAAAVGDGRQMKLRGPGDGAYTAVAASHQFGPTATPDRAYQSFAEVTAFVRQHGAGAYFGADVSAATGEDRYAGWALVVVYRSPGLPLRNLTVFDGLADVGRADPQVITIAGFRTPVSGAVNARLGMVAYEGDIGASGDQAVLNGTQLATRISQGTNFFNGADDDNGSYVTTRDPADRNMLGFDIKNVDAPGILANNATSATISLVSTSDRYFPGVVTTAIDVFAPDFSPSTKSVTNLTGGSPARVGDRLRYTVTFVNDGQDPAVNTSIADPLPAGTSFVPGSLVLPSGVTGGFDAGSGAIQLSPGNFPVGRSVTATFDVLVTASAANTDVANQATISYDGATVPEFTGLKFTTRAATIAVVASADLSIAKVNTPSAAVAGTAVTSTITVTNNGPSQGADVVVTDDLPAGVGAVTATTSRGGSCTVDGDTLTCPIGTIAVAETVTVTVQTPVPPESSVAALTDIARVSSSTADPDPDDNTAAATTDLTRDAALSIAKSAAPSTVAPGTAVTYTVTATNAGPSTADSVAVTDADIDPQILLTGASAPGATCSFDATGARCTATSLAPGGTVVMTVTGLVRPGATPGGVLTNTATVSSATPDGDATDNLATSAITVGARSPGLTVTKSASAPDPVIAGVGQVQYSIDIGNDGPSDAVGVSFTDTLPAGFAVVTASSDRGDCTVAPAPTGDAVSCPVGGLIAPFGGTPGERSRVTILAAVGPAVPAGTYGNTASVHTDGVAPVVSNEAAVTVSSLANVSVVKSFPQGSDAELTPGTTETYRIRVINDGPSVAGGVVVDDSLPAGLSPVAWRSDVTPAGAAAPVCTVATTSCVLGDLPPGTVVELQLDVAVDPGLVIDTAVGVANTATVSTTSDDPNPGDNTSTFIASGGSQADLSIRKIAPTTPPIAGDISPASLASRSFTIELANYGPSTAPGISFTDVLPPGMTFVRLYDPTVPDVDISPFFPCTVTGTPATGQTVDCAAGFDLPAFVGVYFAVEFTVDATVPAGTVLSNTASAASAAEDANLGNNTSTALVPVRAVTNLTVEKLVVAVDPGGNPILPPVPRDQDPLVVPPGYAVSYGILVTNSGPSAAAAVRVTDQIPYTGGIFPTAECDFPGGDVVCAYTNPATGDLLLPGDQYFIQILSLPATDTAPGVYTDTATVTSSTEETTLADNVDGRDIEIGPPVADVIVDKTALTSPLVAGGTFSYQISVRAGLIDVATGVLRLSSNADDVVVTDTLPAGLEPTSAGTSQGDCTVTGQAVRCELGTVRAGVTLDPVAPALVTVTGTVAPGTQPDAGGTIDNTAVVTTSTPLLGGGDAVSATATTPLVRSADLTVTKVADADSVAAGGGVDFTVTVTNTGPSDATGVVLTDLLPAPLEFVAADSDAACAPAGADVVCAIGTVTPGVPRTLTIAATLPSGAAAGSVTNTVSVTSDVDDPDPADNTASAAVDVVQAADLSVTKTAGAEGVLLGGSISYDLVVTNDGPSDATDVLLTDPIPVGTEVASLPADCTSDGTTVSCPIGTLAAGESRSFEVVLTVPDTLPPGPLDNVASVTSATPDPDPTDDSAAASVDAIAQADVTVTKELLTSPAVAGEPVEFRITVFNDGPTVAPNASISDAIPLGTTFVSIAASQGECLLEALEEVPVASCTIGRLEVGQSATATLILDTDPALRGVANTVLAGSGGLDEIPADNEATATGTVVAVSDLSIVKTGPASVAAGAPAEYRLAYSNAGPSTAMDVAVSDTLPAGLTPRPAPGCSVAGTVITCAVGILEVGAGGEVVVTADVSPGLPAGTVLTDIAAIVDREAGAIDPDSTDDSAQLTSTTTAGPTPEGPTPEGPPPTGPPPPGPAAPGPAGGAAAGPLADTGVALGALLAAAAAFLLLGVVLRAVGARPRRRLYLRR